MGAYLGRTWAGTTWFSSQLSNFFFRGLSSVLGLPLRLIVLTEEGYVRFLHGQVMRARKVLLAAANRKVSNPLLSSCIARDSGIRRERGLRVLVIDGGGSKGLIAATVLREIEKLVETKYDRWIKEEHKMIFETT